MRSHTVILSFLTLGVPLSGVHGAALRPRASSSPMVCYQDNVLRALEHSSDKASTFCPEFDGGDDASVPEWLKGFNAKDVSSACDCYGKKTVSSGGAYATGSGMRHKSNSAYPTSFPALSANATVAPSGSGMPVVPFPTASGAAGPVTGSGPMVTSEPSKPSSAAMDAVSSIVSTAGPASNEKVAVSATSSGSVIAGSPPGKGSGKRGLCYDQNTPAGASKFFAGSQYVTYGSNWKDAQGDLLDNSFTFVPTIGVDKNLNNADWSTTIPNLIKAGTKTLFASNEPDNAQQANLTPSQAATVYKKYMQPFKGQALLGTPAVTNGGGQTGLNFLESFIGECGDCSFDFINVHHYLQRTDVNTTQYAQSLKDHIDKDVPAVQAKHTQLKGLPIFVGEWWLWASSEEEGGNLMEDLLPYLDGNPTVMGYQAFGGLWKGVSNFIKPDGTGLTLAGQKYNTYSAAPQATAAL